MPSVIIVARVPRRPWWQRKPRRTLRSIARAVSDLQRAEANMIHASRDACLRCGIEANLVRRAMVERVPLHLLRDADWRHRHVEAPGARLRARLDDEERGLAR